MTYLWAFVVGGLICVAGQLLIDLTSITPARVLVTYVVAGVVLSALGLYDPLAEFAGAGASVPLLGFGHLLAQGVVEVKNRRTGEKSTLPADDFEKAFPAWYQSVLDSWKR